MAAKLPADMDVSPPPASSLAGAALGQAVKLVIWDLDETLWNGTLSEEDVILPPDRAELVRTLNRRGIVSSICSKNDHGPVQERLEREQLWDQFVFPSINWSPKGPRIAQIIEEMQLRPCNVLFIDDNVVNLQEALHFTPELQVAGVELLESLLDAPQLTGKDDSALTRLAQYRMLERKSSDRSLAAGSNEDFLRSCEIRVELGRPSAEDAGRLRELVNRSNQLNFTKSRLSEAEMQTLLEERDGRETRYVRVRDRYGDHGVCGFYSLHAGRLEHFVFSCRILHMGVEQWLFQRLGEPQLEIVGEVASTPYSEQPVDWIETEQPGSAGTSPPVPRGSRRSSRVLLKGGCDLFTLNGFLGGAIKTEFTYTSETGAEVHGDHTEVLRRGARETVASFGAVIDELPFMDHAAYASRIVRRPDSFGTLILSVLMDYTQGLYRLRDTDFVVPFDQHDVDATDKANWAWLEKRWGRVGIEEPFLRWFAERFDYEGPLAPAAFKDNIRWLRGLLPTETKLILINGAEVPDISPREVDRHLHHALMNRALEEVVAELPKTAICDVRPLVTAPENFRENLRHYDRQTYLRMAEQLKVMVGEDLEIEQRPFVMKVHRARRKLARTLERKAIGLALR